MKTLMLGLALLAPLVLTDCRQNPATANQKSAEKTVEKKREIAEKKTETRGDADKKLSDLKREEFAADANRELDRIDQNLKTLKAKADRMTGATKDSIEREIGTLQKRYDTLRGDVKDIKTKAELDLDKAKAKFQSALRDLEKGFKDISQRAG